MTVITMKEIWINPSYTEMGTPIFKIASITGFCGRRSAFASGMVLLRIDHREADRHADGLRERRAERGPGRTKVQRR